MPRASLRSVLLICAFNTACMCRVSTQIAGNSASARAEEPLRQRSGFQSDPLEAVGGVPQDLQKCLRLARHLRFLHNLARVIQNADTRLLDRYVQSGKMVHA